MSLLEHFYKDFSYTNSIDYMLSCNEIDTWHSSNCLGSNLKVAILITKNGFGVIKTKNISELVDV